jgi:hypothetical protein
VGWVLAIDFGTTNTMAAFADDGGSPVVRQYLPYGAAPYCAGPSGATPYGASS